MILSIDTQPTASEGFPESTLVGSGVAVGIGLDDSVAGGQDYNVVISKHNVESRRTYVAMDVQVGLQGCSGRASIRRCRKTVFPWDPLIAKGIRKSASLNPQQKIVNRRTLGLCGQ